MNDNRMVPDGGKLRLRADENAPRHQARAAMQQFDAALDDLAGNWDTLTAAQRTAALRTMLMLMARAVRWLMLRAAA